ncbi:MAG: hypothetical protein M3R07_02370 [Gemmatimonadota bacterium]|nr:hypothetical protein [Gemmatimonadota bacterium]
MLTVAIQGERGSFSDEAVHQIWDGRAVPVPMRDFASVVEAVVQGDAVYGVLPVENTSIGPIKESREALAAAEGDLRVIGELTIAVRHCLLANPAVPLERLRRVFSHPAALAQCSRFLADHPVIVPIVAYDTAGSAADVASRGDPIEAAIAPHGAAARYGLQVVASGIQDDTANATRFVVLASVLADEYPAAWRPTASLAGWAIIRDA